MSSSSPAHVRADQDRADVVAAADRLFYLRGVQAAGMDELRAESGVPLKRIYAAFDSKDDIVVAVLQGRHDLWNTGLARATDPAPTAAAKILAIFDFLAAWFAEPTFRGCAFINVFGELGGSSDEVARLAREHKLAFREYVVELAVEAGGDRQLGVTLALLAEGAQATAALLGTAEPAQEAGRAARALLASTTS